MKVTYNVRFIMIHTLLFLLLDFPVSTFAMLEMYNFAFVAGLIIEIMFYKFSVCHGQ